MRGKRGPRLTGVTLTTAHLHLKLKPCSIDAFPLYKLYEFWLYLGEATMSFNIRGAILSQLGQRSALPRDAGAALTTSPQTSTPPAGNSSRESPAQNTEEKTLFHESPVGEPKPTCGRGRGRGRGRDKADRGRGRGQGQQANRQVETGPSVWSLARCFLVFIFGERGCSQVKICLTNT